MSCLDETMLVELLEHRLDEPTRQRIDAHVDGCSDCRRLLATAATFQPSLPQRRAAAGSSYALLKRLGAGGMGEVYLAARMGPEGFEKRVALKRILPSVQVERERVRMFLDEARLVASLNHRNIGQIFELGEDEEGYFVAMEYVPGPSVRVLLDRLAGAGQRLHPALALNIALQVAEALAYAHDALGPDGRSLQLVHRDVSPQNILVSTSGDVKLIDFGIAKSAQQEHSTLNNSPRGKLTYMSPEQSRGEPLDGRSDLFALGIVLFEMLTNRHPFERGQLTRTLQAIESEPPALPSAVDSKLAPFDALLEKMLAKSPAQRFGDAHQLCDALQATSAHVERPPQRLGQLVSALFGEQIAADIQYRPRRPIQVDATSVDFRRVDTRELRPRRLSPWLVGAAAVLGLAAVGIVALRRPPAAEPAAPVVASAQADTPPAREEAPPPPAPSVAAPSPPGVTAPKKATSAKEPRKAKPAVQLVLRSEAGEQTLRLSASGESVSTRAGGYRLTLSYAAQRNGLVLKTEPWASVTLFDRPLGRVPVTLAPLNERPMFVELQRPNQPPFTFSLVKARAE